MYLCYKFDLSEIEDWDWYTADDFYREVDMGILSDNMQSFGEFICKTDDYSEAMRILGDRFASCRSMECEFLAYNTEERIFEN
jgi:hypothetical protein